MDSRNIELEDGNTKTIFMENYPEVLQKINDWKMIRDAWRKAEQPSEDVRKIFSYLHEVKAIIERDSDKTLYLTEGVLSQKKQNGTTPNLLEVHHPLIYKEVGVGLIGDLDEPESF